MTEEKDVYWEAVWPEIKEYLDNQIFLLKHKKYWNPRINERAIRIAKLSLLPKLKDEEMGTLVAKALGRLMVKEAVDDPEKIICNESVLIPHPFPPIPVRVHSATVYAWEQERILRLCLNEIAQRLSQTKMVTNVFGLIELWRKDSRAYLEAIAFNIAKKMGIKKEHAKKVVGRWQEKLLDMFLPTRFQKFPATKKALHDMLYDIKQDVKKEAFSLDEDITKEEGAEMRRRETIASKNDTPEEVAIKKEYQEKIKSFVSIADEYIKGLPPEKQFVWELSMSNTYTQEEISQKLEMEMGITRDRSRMSRWIRNIKSELKETAERHGIDLDEL